MTPPRRSERAATLSVVVLGSWATLERFAYLSRSPLPVGIDGYWYAARARAVLETGLPDAPTMPLVPYLCAAVAIICGPIVAVKVVAAATVLAQALALWLLVVRRTGEAWAGVVASAVIVTSPGSAYMSAEFVQQGAGMAALLLFLAAIARARDPDDARADRLALAAFGLCLLTHKLAAALAAIGLLAWWGTAGSPPRRAGLWLAGALALGLMLTVVLGGSPRGLLSARLDWSTAPIVFAPGVYWAYGWEVAAAAIAAVLVLALARRGALELRAVDALPIAFALFVALPLIDNHDELGVGFRLRIAAFIALAPLVGLLVASLPLPRRGLVIATLTAGLCLLRSPRPFEGVVWADPRTAAALERLPELLPEDALLVCRDRQLAYMSAWYARAPTHREPPPDADPHNLVRVLPRWQLDARMIEALEAGAKLPAGAAPPIDLDPHRRWGLVLVPETSFRLLSEP